MIRAALAEALIGTGHGLRAVSRALVRAGYRLVADEDADTRLLADLTRAFGARR